MAFLGLMTVKAHEAAVKYLRDQIDTVTRIGLAREQRLTRERDDARSELTTLKAERDRRMAPLIAANAARAAKAKRARNGEMV